MATSRPTTLDRLRTFRALMGDQKEHLTDEEYGHYLAQSSSLCGRLWANINGEADDQESAGSILSAIELFESVAGETTGVEAEEEASSTSFYSHLEEHPFFEFPEEIHSSTFIVEDSADFLEALSHDEFHDLFEEGDFGHRIILEDRARLAVRKPTTSPCA